MNLDKEIDNSLRQLQRRRKTKMTLAIAGLVVVAGGVVALTTLMYTSTPGEISEDRIGEESFM